LTEKGKILRSASVIAVFTVLSRICGYLRDQRIALLLGTSPVADSFILAFRIPNMVRRFTGEGALGASFIPVFTSYLRGESRSDTWRFAQRAFWDLAVVLAALTLLCTVFSKQVVGAFTFFAGASAGHWDLAVQLNRIIFPCILFLGLSGLAFAILNSFHKFALPAASSVIFNLVVIASSFGIIYRPILRSLPTQWQTPAFVLAGGILVASIVQLAMQLPALQRQGMRFQPDVNFSDPGVRKTGKLLAPVLVATGVFQLNFFIDTIFATSSRMPAGSITSLYVGDRIMELTLGVYAIALSTAILPTMSHMAADGRFAEMKQTFGFALRVVSFITIPATVGLILLRVPITRVLFEHGAFTANSTALTANALMYYALGLPAFAAIKLILPMFYATHDTATPTRIGIYVVVFHVALNAILLFAFAKYLWNGGPALASSTSAYLNFAGLFIIFRKRFGALGAQAVARSIAKMVACAAAMAAACIWALKHFPFDAGGSAGLAAQAARLTLMILVATAIYFGAALVLRCEELPEMRTLASRSTPDGAAATDLDG
jgi:putative peptidoglycan lipid II flippase